MYAVGGGGVLQAVEALRTVFGALAPAGRHALFLALLDDNPHPQATCLLLLWLKVSGDQQLGAGKPPPPPCKRSQARRGMGRAEQEGCPLGRAHPADGSIGSHARRRARCYRCVLGQPALSAAGCGRVSFPHGGHVRPRRRERSGKAGSVGINLEEVACLTDCAHRSWLFST
jgi:hypothetical protein